MSMFFFRYNTPSTKILSNEVERQISSLKQGSSGPGKSNLFTLKFGIKFAIP